MLGGQEPDVYFYGETHREDRPEEVPDHRRRLHHVRAADAALADHVGHGDAATSITTRSSRTPLLKAKGVPVLYLPVLYYPINKDDRATGFLMPSYGTSTLPRASR